jgi:hypothetical protein
VQSQSLPKKLVHDHKDAIFFLLCNKKKTAPELMTVHKKRRRRKMHPQNEYAALLIRTLRDVRVALLVRDRQRLYGTRNYQYSFSGSL